MHKYELTIVLPEKTTPAKVKSVTASLEKTLSLLKGKVLKMEEWGKLDFSFKLKGNDSGVFVYFDLELDGNGAIKFRDKLRAEEGMLRYLLIRKED
jgi:Ribosomal protein S6